jgi:hypothetical protein
MKTVFYFFGFLLLNLSCFGQSKLINYFNQLSSEYKHGYVITKKGETYFADAGTGPCKVLVDNKNGFLEIKDQGTGGGTFVMQIAIFKNAKKEDVIAVNNYAFEDLKQGMVSDGNLVFFKAGKQLVDVTKEVLPDMTTAEDQAYNGQADAIMKDYKDGMFEYFELPRSGTTIRFHLGTNALNQACASEDQQACIIQQQLQVVNLYWHKDVGYLSLKN